MQFYLVLLFASFMLFVFNHDRHTIIVSNKISYALFAGLLVLLAGFRYGIESDYWSYYNIFHHVNDPGIRWRFEGGFIFFIEQYKRFISENYNSFVFVTAVLFVSLKCAVFSKLRNPFFALFIYLANFYILLEYNAIRAGIASGFILWAAWCAIQQKKRRSILFFVTACSFHISSVIFLPCYFLIYKKYALKIKTVITLIVCFLVFRLVLFDSFISAVQMIAEKVSLVSLGIALGYIKNDTGLALQAGLARRFVILALFIILNNKKRIENIWFNLYFASVLIYIVFLGSDIVQTRLSSVLEVFMIPMFADTRFRLNSRGWYAALALSALLFALHITILRNGNAAPYQTYLPL